MYKSIKILVVDDSEMVRVNIFYQLRDVFNETNIFFADTIDKAWEILNNNKIDVALVDIYLPGKNGADLISNMLGDKRLKLIPIIVITGTAEDSYIKKSFEKHVFAYLHKPIDNKKLINSIKESLVIEVTK